VALASCGFETHGLPASALVLCEGALHRAGDGYAPRLLHPSHRHAEVVGLHDDDGAPRFEPSAKGVGDLGGETLLGLGPAGVAVQHPDQLGEADDLSLDT
jgi:hypothetical protein